MKARLLILIIAAAFPAAAQTLKFDSFLTQDPQVYFFDREFTFTDRLDRFIRQLKKERRSKVYLVHYRARVADWSPYENSERRAQEAKWEITSRTNIDPDDVVLVHGGVRKADTLEFWIGRKSGGPPDLSPTYSNIDAITCPSILLNNQGFSLNDAEPVVISAEIYPKTDSRFFWHVSAGKIIEGQGTNTIKVDVKGQKRIKITVVGEAIPNACARERTEVFEIGVRAILLDEFGTLPESDLRSRLDYFLQALSEHPGFSGNMIVYGRRSIPRSLEASVRLLTNHFTFRGFPKGRIVVTKGGYRENGGMEIWLLPPGAEQQKARPSVDTKFVAAPAKVRR